MNSQLITLSLSAIVALSHLAVAADTTQAKKRIVFLPGHQSHGWSGHAYTADCKLLADILNRNVPAVRAVVLEGGWPKDVKILAGAAAIVVACDGNGLLGPESNWKALDDLARKGVGIAFLHYAQNDFRKLMLNAVCWIARIDVPSDGVPTETPTVEEMEANLQGDRPQDWTPDRTRQTIERMNRP